MNHVVPSGALFSAEEKPCGGCRYCVRDKIEAMKPGDQRTFTSAKNGSYTVKRTEKGFSIEAPVQDTGAVLGYWFEGAEASETFVFS